jgi:hypothetical protein
MSVPAAACEALTIIPKPPKSRCAPTRPQGRYLLWHSHQRSLPRRRPHHRLQVQRRDYDAWRCCLPAFVCGSRPAAPRGGDGGHPALAQTWLCNLHCQCQSQVMRKQQTIETTHRDGGFLIPRRAWWSGSEHVMKAKGGSVEAKNTVPRARLSWLHLATEDNSPARIPIP